MRLNIFAVATAALAVIASSSASNAAFELRIYTEGGGAPITIVDNGSGDNNDIFHGSMNVSGLFNGFFVEGDIATTNVLDENTGSPVNSDVDTGSLVAQLVQDLTVERKAGGTAAWIEIVVSVTGVVFPTSDPAWLTSIATTHQGAEGGTVEYQSYVDTSNNLFGGYDGPGTATSGVQVPALGQSDTVSVLYDGLTPFSITNRVRFYSSTPGDKKLANVTTNVSPVPEPGTMALLALGGVTLVGARMRRRKAEKVTAA